MACSFNDAQNGYLLFFKFTLASGIFLVQGLSTSVVARFQHVEKTFVAICEEHWENLNKWVDYLARTGKAI